MEKVGNEAIEKMSEYDAAVRIAIYSRKVGELSEKQSRDGDKNGELQNKIDRIQSKIDEMLEMILEKQTERNRKEAGAGA